MEDKLAALIRSHFWQQWWFYLLVVTMFAGVVLIGILRWVRFKVRERVRQLENERAIDAERLRISKDMHDEIGSGLTHIALLSELISTRHQIESQTKREIGVIASTAQKLVQSMGEIIWITHPDNNTIENLVSYLREQTLQYFEPFDVNYFIDVPDQFPPIKLTSVQRRNLFLVTKESLNNALKHASASLITFSVRVEAEKLTFRVVDNGRGFLQETVRPNSNGFRNMKSRIDELHGSFNVRSNPGEGTVVTYSMSTTL